MATINELSDGRPDGVRMGQNAADLVSFHGSSPCDQSPAGTSVSMTDTTQTSAWGFSTSAKAYAAGLAIDAILVCLKEKGLMAAS